MPKSALSRETLEILESMWAQGVHNYSSDENKQKVQQVAVATGLVDEQIKVWIYNRNRKKKVGEGLTKRKVLCASTKKAKSSVKGLMHHHAKKTGCVSKKAAGEEEEVPPPAQDPSLEEEEEEEEEETSRAIMDLPLEEQEHDRQQDRAATILQNIDEKIQELQTCNCETVVMVYNHSSGSLSTTGTQKGLDFLNSQSPGIHWQFAAAVSNNACEYS